MDTEFLLKHGFVDASKEEIKEVLQDRKVKNLHIEVNAVKPIMLLCRTKVKNAVIKLNQLKHKQQERLIIIKSDKLQTRLLNVSLAEIKKVLFKDYGNGMIEILFGLAEKGINISICYQEKEGKNL